MYVYKHVYICTHTCLYVDVCICMCSIVLVNWCLFGQRCMVSTPASKKGFSMISWGIAKLPHNQKHQQNLPVLSMTFGRTKSITIPPLKLWVGRGDHTSPTPMIVTLSQVAFYKQRIRPIFATCNIPSCLYISSLKLAVLLPGWNFKVTVSYIWRAAVAILPVSYCLC